jgi:hypothetical protein
VIHGEMLALIDNFGQRHRIGTSPEQMRRSPNL